VQEKPIAFMDQNMWSSGYMVASQGNIEAVSSGKSISKWPDTHRWPGTHQANGRFND